MPEIYIIEEKYEGKTNVSGEKGFVS